LLVVLGTSLLDSVDHAMSRSIIGSVAGNIQVYSAKSKDELAVMGSFNMDGDNLQPIDDFTQLRDTLMKVPNVKSVVPMGIAGAIVTSGNTIDLALAELRDLYRKRARLQGEAGGGDGSRDRRQEGPRPPDGHRASTAIWSTSPACTTSARCHPRTWRRSSAPHPRVLGRVRPRSAAAAGVPGEPHRPPGHRRGHVVPALRGHRPGRLRQVLRPHEGGGRPPPYPHGERGFMFAKYTYEEQVKLRPPDGSTR
jgi:hypothetical protein